MKIKTIEVKNLWGNKNVSMAFNKDLTFLIGMNGHGKTTILNLILGLLHVDSSKLNAIEFEEVILHLKHKGENTIIKVQKPNGIIHYDVSKKNNGVSCFLGEQCNEILIKKALSKFTKKCFLGDCFNVVARFQCLCEKLHYKKWRETQNKNKLKNFIQIINRMFSGKTLQFHKGNLRVYLDNGHEMPLRNLSSGEKKMFVFLGEVLLQTGKPVVSIYDNPENSLHIEWQDSLFQNVRQLNERCQIISVTHSPNIVGSFQNRIIHVEDCIK